MKGKTMTVRILVGAALLAGAAAALPAQSGLRDAPRKPRVEVAFVLDSTGSMDGLIEGAKRKIWSIANGIIARQPAPEVRIGLVTYRDRGDEYVTRRLDLTDDIDAVFAELSSYRAGGGGDGPESVNQALLEAVSDLAWSGDRSVLKIVFLVGDYPPHMDYPDDVKYRQTCAEAVRKDLTINTVQCGGVAETTPVWRDIARLAEGQYVALEQSGNMGEIVTPYDEEIARASASLARTVVAYGTPAAREAARGKSEKAAAAAPSVAADRAAYNLASGGRAIQGTGDLVADVAEGRVDPSKLKKEELPPEMKGMGAPERENYLAVQVRRRGEINALLADLSERRARYIRQEAARQAAAGTGDSFDAKVGEIIAAQAARKR